MCCLKAHANIWMTNMSAQISSASHRQHIYFSLHFFCNKISTHFGTPCTHGPSRSCINKIKGFPFLSLLRYIYILHLVTIPLKTYGILPPEAAIVCCGRRPQYSWVTGEPIHGQRPPQLLVAGGHKDLWVKSPG